MRPAIPALFFCALLLCTAPAAFCQSTVPAPANPGIAPPSVAPPPPLGNFNHPPRDWHFNGMLPEPKIVVPPTSLQFKDHAQIDPGMVMHPPKSSLGEQPPGTLVAQNLYPGLQLLPINENRAKLEPIPITWPNFKLEQIPIDVSNGQAILIGKGAPSDQKKKK